LGEYAATLRNVTLSSFISKICIKR